MSKIEITLLTITGFFTAAWRMFLVINVDSILSSLVLGFSGAAGGWLFAKVAQLIFKNHKNNKTP